MRIIWKKRVPGAIEFGIMYGAIALLAVMAASVLPLLAVAPSCVWKGLTGIPCPTCGATRALVLLAHGDIAQALIMHPLVALGVIGSIALFCYDLLTLLIPLPRPALLLTHAEKRRAPIIAVAGLALLWSYIVVTQSFLIHR